MLSRSRKNSMTGLLLLVSLVSWFFNITPRLAQSYYEALKIRSSFSRECTFWAMRSMLSEATMSSSKDSPEIAAETARLCERESALAGKPYAHRMLCSSSCF